MTATVRMSDDRDDTGKGKDKAAVTISGDDNNSRAGITAIVSVIR